MDVGCVCARVCMWMGGGSTEEEAWVNTLMGEVPAVSHGILFVTRRGRSGSSVYSRTYRRESHPPLPPSFFLVRPITTFPDRREIMFFNFLEDNETKCLDCGKGGTQNEVLSRLLLLLSLSRGYDICHRS